MTQICGSCGATWTAGAPACPSCRKAGTAIDATPCPMCAEPVALGAANCRWCGEAVGTGRPAGGVGAPRAAGFQALPPPPIPTASGPDGTAALVVSILGAVGMFACGIPAILGPIAWIMASGVEKRRLALGLPPDGMAQAAKVIGIIVTILLILGLLALAAFIGVAVIGAAAVEHSGH